MPGTGMKALSGGGLLVLTGNIVVCFDLRLKVLDSGL